MCIRDRLSQVFVVLFLVRFPSSLSYPKGLEFEFFGVRSVCSSKHTPQTQGLQIAPVLFSRVSDAEGLLTGAIQRYFIYQLPPWASIAGSSSERVEGPIL
eukprot:TRINITY_DN28429_c0_g1_i1.p2 TRINITY_DN28429_c0_g1~~TRINITY_DN28429_c0_g1_i1.p2  ORF type:complete len:100 (+),score=4.90 TRINITY_DN28429_c0_g1_i1:66-365(+)